MLELSAGYAWPHQWLGLAHLQKGSHRQAIGALEKAVALSKRKDPEALWTLGYGCAVTGDRAGARRILYKMEAMSSRFFGLSFGRPELRRSPFEGLPRLPPRPSLVRESTEWIAPPPPSPRKAAVTGSTGGTGALRATG